ncbi:TPR repeat-containing protein YrrB [Thiorhodovibrio winogradskyi]|uniref:TPR repeat-containing protein YrrB n=1 Tax=Thiorhodovibrio winogradskyi TaxID=77007 RepID=A0ABZ0SG21_9GAMM|nr:tetratricopeptide repeat protein [Thiorhodovibrio winogradskyi]
MKRSTRRPKGRAGHSGSRFPPKTGKPLDTLLQTALEKHHQGDLGAATQLYSRILEQAPRHADALHLLGVACHQTGDTARGVAFVAEAIAVNDQDAAYHSNHGLMLKALARLDEALAAYDKAIRIKPDFANAHTNRAAVLIALMRTQEALDACDTALALTPDLPDAHNTRGVALKDLGRQEEALAAYDRALAIHPAFAEAHCNRGNILKSLERSAEAETSFERALAINPQFATAHTNLALVLNERGCHDRAARHLDVSIRLRPADADTLSAKSFHHATQGEWEQAEHWAKLSLRHRPDDGPTLKALASCLVAQGRADAGLQVILRSLELRDDREARQLFVQCVKGNRFSSFDEHVHHLLTRALNEGWTRPTDLAAAATTMLKCQPGIQECLSQLASIERKSQSCKTPMDHWQIAVSSFAPLAENPLLLALLRTSLIPDVEFERALTIARRVLLYSADLMTDPADTPVFFLRLTSALAQHCFLNEYLFDDTEDEIRTAWIWRDRLTAALHDDTEITTAVPLIVSAYFPLNSIAGAMHLLEKSWPDAAEEVLTQQLREPAAEQALHENIPKLTRIDDQVSLLVRSQYEENPYPRWSRLGTEGIPRATDRLMKALFPRGPYQQIQKPEGTDILVAGCGTGQNSIETARRFSNARVLAIDLSHASLSYAKRKSDEFGVTSIDYAQADILDLRDLDRSFDVIEAAGVLHHLHDPFQGWKILISMLRPLGLMRVGLYSAIARRNIMHGRELIKEMGYKTNAQDIRRCRREIVRRSTDDRFRQITQILDFYSISMCRDLLFHRQEHQMTLPEIRTFLRAHRLEFLGFEKDPAILTAYRKRYPDDLPATNLEYWSAFEQENPNVFLDMYQFWIQKLE